MDRRKKGSGQITKVPGRKSPWRAAIVDSSGKHKNDPDFDLATFSKSIGHSSIRTTMEIYAHLDMTQNRYVQRSVEDLKEF